MKMTSGSGWKWSPSSEQRKLFGEWRELVIGYFVSCPEGTYVKSIPRELEERTGELIPLDQMGFPSIKQFLYEMRNDLEIRTMGNKLFAFVQESAVPSNYLHIRKLVLGQKSKTKDVIKSPSKTQTTLVGAEKLLSGPTLPQRRVVTPSAPRTPPQRPTLNDFYSSANSQEARSQLTLLEELLERVKTLELRNQQLERENGKMHDLEEKNRKLKERIKKLNRDKYGAGWGKGKKKKNTARWVEPQPEVEDASSDEDYYYEAQETLVEEEPMTSPPPNPKTGRKNRRRRAKKFSGCSMEPGIYQQQRHMLQVNYQLLPGDLGYFQCACGKVYSSKRSACQHINSKNNLRGFRCEVCGKMMNTTKKGFLNHYRDAHDSY